MGTVYLTYIANVLRDGGLPVEELDGWQTRARRSGGYDPPGCQGMVWHHTAENPISDGWPSANYMTFRADAKPVANCYVDRTGTWWVCAAGATNTEGVGGPIQVASGYTFPKDGANARVLSIEVGNNGVGEPYPEIQQENLLHGSAILWLWIGNQAGWRIPEGLGSIQRFFMHWHWTNRKIDNWGPSRWSRGGPNTNTQWDLGKTRHDLLVAAAEIEGVKPPTTEPAPGGGGSPTGRYYVVSGDSPWSVAEKVYGSGSRYTTLEAANPGVWHPGQIITIPNKPSMLDTVKSGDSPYSVLRRMFPNDNPANRLDVFYTYNGGASRVLHPGDPVACPI